MNRLTINSIVLAILFLSNLKASDDALENKEPNLITGEEVAVFSLTPLMEYAA